MALIKLTTRIHAPVETCFNLSRSIDVHLDSMHKNHEQAIAGTTSGLLNLNETVTWKATHLFCSFKMTVKLTELEYPKFFVDQMIKGPFRLMRHYHTFKTDGDSTLMLDEFVFRSPFGWIGKIVDLFFLKPYMRKLLQERNGTIKTIAEEGTIVSTHSAQIK